jgi:DNA-binding NarL/FixJ family response regulator
MQAVTLAVVEDHPEFRCALTQALGEKSHLTLLPACNDLPEGMRLLEHVCPDILLVDLGLPSGSGLALIHYAQRRWGSRCTSVVLTVTGNEEHLLTAIRAGAKGYLYKSDEPSQWLQTVKTLSEGASPLHAQMAGSFLHQGLTLANGVEAVLQHIAAGYTFAEVEARLNLPPGQAGLHARSAYDHLLQLTPKLSERETELLHFLNRGIPFKQCAAMMGVTEATTKTLAGRAYQKLGATNLQSALYEARAASLIA